MLPSQTVQIAHEIIFIFFLKIHQQVSAEKAAEKNATSIIQENSRGIN